MFFLGYAAALLIGLALGLMGGGGSILTVPILVYLFGVTPLLATSYSLLIVGLTSAVGALRYRRSGWVDGRVVALLGTASVVAVLTVRQLLLPQVPPVLLHLGSWPMTRGWALMMLFGVLMLLSAWGMLRPKGAPSRAGTAPASSFRLVIQGAGIGAVTGMLGAGGGFLLIPALVLLARLPMKRAIGTSLSIIALSALIGFAGDAARLPLDWGLLLPVTGLSLTGLLVGTKLSSRLRGDTLRRAFGWLVLFTGMAVLLLQLVHAGF